MNSSLRFGVIPVNPPQGFGRTRQRIVARTGIQGLSHSWTPVSAGGRIRPKPCGGSAGVTNLSFFRRASIILVGVAQTDSSPP